MDPINLQTNHYMKEALDEIFDVSRNQVLINIQFFILPAPLKGLFR